jgi:hypothetical protein
MGVVSVDVGRWPHPSCELVVGRHLRAHNGANGAPTRGRGIEDSACDAITNMQGSRRSPGFWAQRKREPSKSPVSASTFQSPLRSCGWVASGTATKVEKWIGAHPNWSQGQSSPLPISGVPDARAVDLTSEQELLRGQVGEKNYLGQWWLLCPCDTRAVLKDLWEFPMPDGRVRVRTKCSMCQEEREFQPEEDDWNVY